VVDDDLDNLEVTREALALLGHEADVAQNGEEALARLSRTPALDVILCDVGMPGMSGWELAERARAIAPDLPIFMLTGWAHEVGPEDPRRSTVRGVVGKPIELHQLGALVASVVEPQARPAGA
jgi:CheY-like chemotaxis protein